MALCRETYSSPSDGSGVFVDSYRCYSQETPRQPHGKRRRFHPLRGLRNIFKRKTKLSDPKFDPTDQNPDPYREAAKTPDHLDEAKPQADLRSPSPPRSEVIFDKHHVFGNLSKESITKSSHSTCSEGSLLSSEPEEAPERDDLSVILSPTQPLTHNAAKHKMAIRPKKNHAMARARKSALPIMEEDTSTAFPTSLSNPSISPQREISYKSASLPAGVVPGEAWANTSSQDGFFSRLLARKSGKKKKPVESRQRVQPLTISATDIPKSHSFRKQDKLQSLDPIVTPSLSNIDRAYVWVSCPGNAASEGSITGLREESTVWVSGGSYDPLTSNSGPESFLEPLHSKEEPLSIVSINGKCVTDSVEVLPSTELKETQALLENEVIKPGTSIVSITLNQDQEETERVVGDDLEETERSESVEEVAKENIGIEPDSKECAPKEIEPELVIEDNVEKDNRMDYIVEKPEVKEALKFEINHIAQGKDFDFTEKKMSLSELSSVFEKKNSTEAPPKFVGRQKSFNLNKVSVKKTEEEPKPTPVKRPQKEQVAANKYSPEEKSPVRTPEEESTKRIVESSRRLFDEQFTQRKAFEEIRGSTNEQSSPKKTIIINKEKAATPHFPKDLKSDKKVDSKCELVEMRNSHSSTEVDVMLRQRHSREIIRSNDEEPELLKVFARRSLKVKDLEEEEEDVPVKSRDSDKENDDSVTIERKKIEYQRSVSTEDCILNLHNVCRQRSKTLPDLSQPKTVLLKHVDPVQDGMSEEPKFKRIQQRKEEWEKRAQQAMGK